MKKSQAMRYLLTMVIMAATVLLPRTALAASVPPAGTGAASGWVRFGHFAPSSDPVDLLVDDVVAATGLAYKGVSPYMAVSAGPHRFAIRASGQPDAPNVLEIEAGVPVNGAVTIGAVTTLDGVATQVYDDALTTPPSGASLVRFIHAAPDVSSVDIAVTSGDQLAAAVSYPGATDYLPIAAGTYDLDVYQAGTSTLLLHIGGWSIEAGVQSSVILIRGLDGRLDVAPVVDSGAASLAPVGGVQTGFGGMAPRSTSTPVWPLLLAPVTLALGALSIVRAQRAARLRLAPVTP